MFLYLQKESENSTEDYSSGSKSIESIEKINTHIEDLKIKVSSLIDIEPRVSSIEKELRRKYPQAKSISDSEREKIVVPLRNEIENLKREIMEIVDEWKSNQLDNSEKEKLVEFLKENIEAEATEEFLQKIQASILSVRQNDEFRKEMFDWRDEIVSRLANELSKLAKRGNLNLVIGIMVAFLGMSLLGYFVFFDEVVEKSQKDPSFENFLYLFIPRISLVVIVEIFSYFFLRLYSLSLIEIKYFQNELTNVQTKYSALKAAVYLDSPEAIREVILEFSNTERNFLIRKGQTTADLERSKIEKESNKDLLRNSIAGVYGNLFTRRRF